MAKLKINGIQGLTGSQLDFELQRGAKFVLYQYCISIVVLTFKRPSDIYFVRSGENSATKGLPFTLLSLVAGWWGIPWGPIYSIGVQQFQGRQRCDQRGCGILPTKSGGACGASGHVKRDSSSA
jgi:hypothetical protein